MIAISIEQPPQGTAEELAEYLNRMLIQMAGALQEADAQIAALQQRVKTLESKP